MLQAIRLPPVTKTGILDPGGNPFGSGTAWTVLFQPSDISTRLTRLEMYQATINGPVGSSVLLAVDAKPWNYVNQGWNNSYDPSQPMPWYDGQAIEFWWNVPFTNPPYDQVSNIQPTVTVWLRVPATQPDQGPGIFGQQR